MATLLGEELDRFLAALAAPAAGLRVNTLRIDPARFAEISPFPLTPLGFPREGFLLPDGASAGRHPYHAAGLYYLQDPGAMVVGALPELPEAPRVLDLAAAPGGKATHLAARMAGAGVLVANDVNPGRAWELAGNLERCGVGNAIVTSESPGRLAERWGDSFDLVLVDAPCSGESMFHKSAAARREWSPAAVAGCARRQGELLLDAVGLVRPGGTLLYSTCTFAPEENEAVLAGLLAARPELELATLPAVPGGEAGRPEWGGPAAPPQIDRAVRLWPHRVPGAGHFVAALRRSAAAGAPEAPAAVRAQRAEGGPWIELPADVLTMLLDLLGEIAPGLQVDGGRLVLQGGDVHLLPPQAPEAGDLRVLRAGWWIGTVRRGWVEPSHALAMGLRREQAAQVLDLDATAPDAEAYLRGEVLRRPGADGWVLVCVDGFAVGWGKRSGGTVKNHYPKGLRRR